MGLTERLSLTGILPLRSTELNEPGKPRLETTGAGDIQLGVRHALTNPEGASRFAAVLTGGVWLPTAASNDATTIGENISFGRGAVTLAAGGEISIPLGKSSRMTGQVDMQFPTGADTITDPNGHEAGYRFAPVANGSLLFSGPFPGGRFSWVGGVSERYAGVDTMRGSSVKTRGGLVGRLVGGFVWSLGPRQNVGILAERLALANVRGDDVSREGQILARTEIVVAWQGTFGSHRHDD